MRVALASLGCRLNEAELEHWGAGFIADGHQLVRSPEDADLIVINTCAVTQEAVRKSRRLIRRSQRQNAKAKLIVSGCYASLDANLENDIAGIDLLIDNAEKDRLVDIVKQKLAIHSMPAIATEPGEIALFARGRNRAFVKLQDGCRHKCTFCIVTVARGEERSRTIKDIVTEINTLHGQNILEVILTGVHIGGYGRDLNTDLTVLLKTILAETAIARIRLGSLEPWDLHDGFFSLFDNPRLMPHLHLPLQSGSDTTLKRMARRCKTADFAKLVEKARRSAPQMNITTDVIVGFPGETDGEWRDTLAFCQQMAFSHIHIFPYSPRKGTYAETLPGHISSEIKKSRSRELHNLTRELKHHFARAHIGHTLPVLIENDTGHVDGQTAQFGYSPNYLRVAVPVAIPNQHVNNIKPVRINSYDEGRALLVADGIHQ